MVSSDPELVTTTHVLIDGKSVIRDTEIAFPETRNFRDAWQLTNPSVVSENVDAARNIALTRVREVREGLLTKLDQQSLILIEAGQPLTSVIDKKELLRNITEPIKSAKTIDDVRQAEQSASTSITDMKEGLDRARQT